MTSRTNDAPLVAIAVVALVLAAAAACGRKTQGGTPAAIPALPASSAATVATAPATTSLTGAALPGQPEAVQQARAWALGAGGTAHGAAPSELADAPDLRQAISGTIRLPPGNRTRVARGDVMFLAARRLGGPPGPGSMLAVQKLVAEDFPMAFTLSARDAMIPGVPFEGKVSITVRVDKDGDALTRKKGDVTGRIDGVSVGARDVVVSLATVESEDRTIASPEAVQRAMLPAGHP